MDINTRNMLLRSLRCLGERGFARLVFSTQLWLRSDPQPDVSAIVTGWLPPYRAPLSKALRHRPVTLVERRRRTRSRSEPV